jgi:uncharacterized membrane protein
MKKTLINGAIWLLTLILAVFFALGALLVLANFSTADGIGFYSALTAPAIMTLLSLWFFVKSSFVIKKQVQQNKTNKAKKLIDKATKLTSEKEVKQTVNKEKE